MELANYKPCDKELHLYTAITILGV